MNVGSGVRWTWIWILVPHLPAVWSWRSYLPSLKLIFQIWNEACINLINFLWELREMMHVKCLVQYLADSRYLRLNIRSLLSVYNFDLHEGWDHVLLISIVHISLRQCLKIHSQWILDERMYEMKLTDLHFISCEGKWISASENPL